MEGFQLRAELWPQSIFKFSFIGAPGWLGWLKVPTSAQVMISRLMSSSPASGSVLTARSLEPALDSVCPSVSLLLPCSHPLSLSLKNQ